MAMNLFRLVFLLPRLAAKGLLSLSVKFLERVSGQNYPSGDFQYDSSLDQKTIRLVRIGRPRGLLTSLACPNLQIENYRLDDDLPAYVALSYTWGPPKDGWAGYEESNKRLILLNGEWFEVWPNLYDAIYQISSSYESPETRFWIDAICINQKDVKERESQVAIMDRIYRHAKQVIVWLGKDDHETSRALELMKWLFAAVTEAQALEIGDVQSLQDIYTKTRHIFQKDAILQDISVAGGGKLPSFDSPEWAKVNRFFQRRWFSRVWVIQEVALGKNVVVLCGKHALSWETLADYCVVFTSFGLGIKAAILDKEIAFSLWPQTFVSKSSPLAGFSQLSRITATRARLGGDETARNSYEELCSGFLSENKEIKPNTSLLFLMSYFAESISTDPRDKVYAFLGLVNYEADTHNKPHSSLNVKYSESIPVSKVFETVITSCMEEIGSPAPLSLLADTSVKEDDELPSWVPDFASPAYAQFLTVFAQHDGAVRPTFTASGRKQYKSQEICGNISFAGKELTVQGTRLGVIGQIFDNFHDLHSISENAGSFLPIVLKMDPIYSLTRQPRFEALWRTLTMDTCGFVRPSKPEVKVSFTNFITMGLVGDCIDMRLQDKPVHDIIKLIQHFRELRESDTSNSLPDMDDFEAKLREAGLLEESTYSPDPSKKEHLKQWLKSLEESRQQFFDSAAIAMAFRRVLFTNKGYLGLGPQSSMPGDDIWIVSGCSWPVVFRKCSTDSFKFSLVGTVYIHGLMFGEAVGPDVYWQKITIV